MHHKYQDIIIVTKSYKPPKISITEDFVNLVLKFRIFLKLHFWGVEFWDVKFWDKKFGENRIRAIEMK